ncbi:hypothetical protein SBADM41S_06437 [Streptomyces badius]
MTYGDGDGNAKPLTSIDVAAHAMTHGLQRAQRVVEPDVAARVELLRHAHAVVRQEHDAVAHARVVREPHQLLHQPLPAVVGRVGLARDDDLDRMRRVEQQLPQPVAVAQHQRQPLVRGDAAGEADGQDVRVEDAVDPAQFGGARAAPAPGGVEAAADLGDELAAQIPAQVPDLLVADAGHRVPPAGRAGLRGGLVGHRAAGQHLVGAALADLARAEPEHLGGDPGRGVDPVGDGGDRDLGGVEARPEPGEHLPADRPVQGGDAVGALGEPEAHHRHVEQLRFAAGVGLGAERQDLLDGDAGQFALGAEVAGDERPVETVYAGGHRGVGGEDGPGPDHFQGGLEVESGGDEFADALQTEEAGVALVGVEHLRFRGAGQPAPGAYGTHPADAEQHLLEEAVVAAAAVEPVGDIAFAGGVLLDVRVEKEQRHPADPGEPDARVQRASAGQCEDDPGGGAVGLADQVEREFVGVENGIVLLLPALAREGLAEVAVPVQQPDADERDAEVAGGLEVVAGQDAEAAAVLGQGGGDTEFG